MKLSTFVQFFMNSSLNIIIYVTSNSKQSEISASVLIIIFKTAICTPILIILIRRVVVDRIFLNHLLSLHLSASVLHCGKGEGSVLSALSLVHVETHQRHHHKGHDPGHQTDLELRLVFLVQVPEIRSVQVDGLLHRSVDRGVRRKAHQAEVRAKVWPVHVVDQQCGPVVVETDSFAVAVVTDCTLTNTCNQIKSLDDP